MTGFITPTKCYVESCTIRGVDIVKHLNTIRVFETLCKPYITGQLEVLDTNNIIENMGLVGGEPVSFTINSTRSSRTDNLHILSIKGETSTQGLRAMRYTIELIGPEYFGDRGNLVQQSFEGITGTDAISKIHSQFLGDSIDVQVPSIGLLGKDNSYVVSSTKPFKAVNDIIKVLQFAQYQTGNVMHWVDKDGAHLAPLEHLFKTLTPQETFYQEATWGKSWRDIARAEYAIIAASALVNPEQGRTSMTGVSATANQERKVSDLLTNKKVHDNPVAQVVSGAAAGTGIGSFLGSLVSSVTGGHGGSHNYYLNDSSRIPNANSRQTEKEKAYGNQIANGPQFTIKVPIQPGLRCVVGKGIHAKLQPPVGDQTSPFSSPSQTGGDMLIIDAMHEVHLDDTQMAGTSTFRCAKGGWNT